MDNPVKLEILLPAQAELEEIARVHMALSGPQSARSVTNEIVPAVRAAAARRSAQRRRLSLNSCT